MLRILILSAFLLLGCQSQQNSDLMPSKSDYAGYDILNLTKDHFLDESYRRDDKIAVVVRNKEGYEWITPQYSNAMVSLDGQRDCCLVGNSMDKTKTVFLFSFIGFGMTKIDLVARKKGLDTYMKTDPSDDVVSISLKIK